MEFGREYQHVAAISLAMEYIDTLNSVRVEARVEDIEIYTDRGTIYIQAKSDVKGESVGATTDLRNALDKLSDLNKEPDCIGIIYTTNADKPFGAETDYREFVSGKLISYENLNKNNRDLVDEYIQKIQKQIKKEHLKFHTVIFKGDDESKYTWIIEHVTEFLKRDVNLYWRISPVKLFHTWIRYLQSSASDRNKSIRCEKRKLVWGLIIQQIDSVDSYLNDDNDDDMDIGQMYGKLINQSSEKFDLISKMTNRFHLEKEKYQNNIDKYIESESQNHTYVWDGMGMDEDLKLRATKILMKVILGKMNFIKKVKGDMKLAH